MAFTLSSFVHFQFISKKSSNKNLTVNPIDNIYAAQFQTCDRSQTQLMRIKMTTPSHKKAKQELKKLPQ